MTKQKQEILINESLKNEKIAVVIPAYKTADTIVNVLKKIPDYVKIIYIINDASPDNLETVVNSYIKHDGRVNLINHEKNMGVGASMKTGYLIAKNNGYDICIKIDSDDQMDLEYLPNMILPIIQRKADYVKGNRFKYLNMIQKMPLNRRFGNISLSFLTKIASGYWDIFDCTNGFTVIRTEIFNYLNLQKLHDRFFFEINVLIELGILRAVVKDVYVPAFYPEIKKSSLSEFDSLFRFPRLLLKGLLRRILINYFIRDFNTISLFIVLGCVLEIIGLIFGITNWMNFASKGIGTPIGTIMITFMMLIIGFLLTLQAIVVEINNVPSTPITSENFYDVS